MSLTTLTTPKLDQIRDRLSMVLDLRWVRWGLFSVVFVATWLSGTPIAQ